MPIPLKPFYMIRHGESVGNLERFTSGSLDVALTERGRQQAIAAQKAVETLKNPPEVIFHSPLSRARITAELINTNLQLPMNETPSIAEQYFGDWEKQSWNDIYPKWLAEENPPNGEAHEDFYNRVKTTITNILNAQNTLPLIVCHGGVFRAFYALHNALNQFQRTENAKLYHFEPCHDTPQETHKLPWNITLIE